MKRFYIAAPTTYEDKLIEDLGKLGVTELIKEYTIKGFQKVDNVEISEKYLNLQQRISSILETVAVEKPRKESFLEKLKSSFSKPSSRRLERAEVKLEEVESYVKDVETQLDEKLRSLEKTQAEIDELKTLDERISIFLKNRIRIDQIGAFKHLFVKAGFLNTAFLTKLEKYVEGTSVTYSALPIPERRRENLLILTGLNEDKQHIEDSLKLLNFEEIRFPEGTNPDPLEALTETRRAIQEREEVASRVKGEVRKIGDGFIEKSAVFEPHVRRVLGVEEARSTVSRTQTLSLIHGWVPSNNVAALKEAVEQSTGGAAYLKFDDPSPEEEPPVQLHNKGVLRYFELLTFLRGFPRYFELDPTPITAILFPIMFGMMFGDVGGGLCFVVLGLIFSRVYKGFLGISAGAMRMLGGMFLVCGISSIFFGFLYGEVFLFEMFHPLWLSPLHDQTRIVVIAILFGCVQLGLGLTLNIMNELRSKHPLKAILGSRGLIGLVYYVVGVYVAIKYVQMGMDLSVFRQYLPFTLVVVSSLVLVFLSPTIEEIAEKKPIKTEGLMMGFGEALETFISYLCNSISYVRLAAFAMSHAALGLSAAILAGMIGTLPSYLFLNILVFIIEGLSVLIQSLRLTYYEFFSKFYSGTGIAYKPFSL